MEDITDIIIYKLYSCYTLPITFKDLRLVKTLKASEIFISYVKQDKDFVDKISLFFKNNNLNCWVDETDIQGSDDYLKSIANAIVGAKIMVVVLSSDTHKSDFVKNEIRLAIEHKLKIIVFKVEIGVTLEGLEFFLGMSQYINAYQGNFDDKVEKLYIDCCALLQLSPSELIRKKQSLFSTSFSLNGRIGRLEYNLSLIIYFVFAIAWTQWAKHKYQNFSLRITVLDTFLSLFILVITNWFIFSQLVKRCHDISKSAWYIINPLFIIVLPFQKGVLNKNLYGNNPKTAVILKQSRNFKNYYALATCLLCFLTFVFGPVTDSYSYKTTPLKKGFKLYQSFDYSLQYPSNWGLDTTGKSGCDFIAYAPLSPEVGQYQENIATEIEYITGKGLDLKTFIAIVLHRDHNQGGITHTNFLDTALTFSNLNKMQYYKVLSTYEVKSSKVYEEMNVYMTSTIACAITFTYAPNVSDHNKVLGRAALQSFIIKNN
jgi:uncharacterized membrane protein YhaH (DUF805 family)